MANRRRFRMKPAAVIPVADLFLQVVSRYILRRGDGFNAAAERRFQFGLRAAEHCGIAGVHGKVGQIVQIGERRRVGEFARSGNKHQTFIIFTGFDHGIKPFEKIQDCLGGMLADAVQYRLVVFVDHDHDLRRFPQALNQTAEQGLGIFAFAGNAGFCRRVIDGVRQRLPQRFRRVARPAVPVQMNDRIRFPVVRFGAGRQTFEQLFFPSKIAFRVETVNDLPKRRGRDKKYDSPAGSRSAKDIPSCPPKDIFPATSFSKV